MTTSFSLAGSDLLLEAFERLQIKPSELTSDHMFGARRSMNLLQSSWANRGTNLWKVDNTASPQNIPLSQAVATYNIDPSIIMVLDTYLVNTTLAVPADRPLNPLSRNDYASLPNKLQQGPPTSYYFDRQASVPTITLWTVPDFNNTYALKFFSVHQQQDASILLNSSPDIPFRFNEALVSGLTFFLSKKYPPPKDSQITMADIKTSAVEAWLEAAEEDRERVPTYVAPDLSDYFR